MTAPNAPAPTVSLSVIAAKAHRLHNLIEAADVVCASLPLELPKTQCMTTLNAVNSIGPMIELLNEKAEELAHLIDLLEGDNNRNARASRA